jgi:hypothetical protein
MEDYKKMMNKTKSLFCENANKIEKPREYQEKIQRNKIRNERGAITIDNTEVQMTIRNYNKQSYVYKLDSLEEMDEFLIQNNLRRLIQEKIDNRNRSILSKKTESLIKNISNRRKFQILTASLMNFIIN